MAGPTYAQICRQAPVPRQVGLLTVPKEAADAVSESASTHGDDAFSGASSSCCSSPRESSERSTSSSEEHSLSKVIVKSTFIDLADETPLQVCYRRMRKNKTDSVLLEAVTGELQIYTPGKFSDDMQARSGAQQQADSESQQLHWQQDTRTTVMMRNLPNNYTRDMLLAMLDEQGFAGYYDFIYLPCDFSRNANLGYAFVNLVDPQTVDAFWRVFDGFSYWALPTAKVCQVRWSGPHQGLEAHIERYRNSPVMHKSVSDEYRPMIFAKGVRQPFPKPTKRIKAPHKTSSR